MPLNQSDSHSSTMMYANSATTYYPHQNNLNSSNSNNSNNHHPQMTTTTMYYSQSLNNNSGSPKTSICGAATNFQGQFGAINLVNDASGSPRGAKLSSASIYSDCSSTASGNSSDGNTSFDDSPANSRKHGQQYRAKYKTEICKDWEVDRYCPKGDKCSFAHGVHELRKKVHVSQKYKTTKCRSFHERGFCIYGPRCQFLHDVRMEECNINLSARNQLSYKALLNENLTHLNDVYARTGCDLSIFIQNNIYYNSDCHRGRLNVFQSLTKGK